MEIGQKVESLRDFESVPKGTFGYVIEDYGTGITIAWDLPDKPYPRFLTPAVISKMLAIHELCPLRDGFDKKTDLIFLKPVEDFKNETEFKEGVFKMGRCAIIVSVENGKWHLSISTPTASPSYKEIKEARYKFLPDNIVVAQIFPPKAEFVNLHPYCHHLWEIEM